MKCPNCNETLMMTERQGVEIDYCPSCRGVWLDRGELDKIIEKSMAQDLNRIEPQPPSQQFPQHNPPQQPYHRKEQYDPYYKKKKRGFLGDLFDFD